MPVVVFGIGGVSRSGKSSLCRKLKSTMDNVTHFQLDRYFDRSIPTLDPDMGMVDNWEDPKCILFDMLVSDVQICKKQH